MATDTEKPVEVDLREAWRFQKDLPDDREKARLAKGFKLLEGYSGISADEVEAHVRAIRDKAFAIFHYPCIGRWRFLDLYLTSSPRYADVVARLRGGERLLDVGTCFGHMLRQLALDGAPAANLAGLDLRPEFVELGYELFRDRDRFAARFVAGDVLDPTDSAVAALDGRFDIIHAASFFHLFGWDDQVRVGERMVRFFRPGAQALVLGRQVGNGAPPSVEEWRESGARSYHHNVETMQKLWDVIGENTGTEWKVTGRIVDVALEDMPRQIIRFAVSKVEK